MRDPQRRSKRFLGNPSPERLITSIVPARTRKASARTFCLPRKYGRNGRRLRFAAACCPAFARTCPKIPFFCPAVVTPRGLISARGRAKWGDCHMTIKVSGRSALILAAGLWVCFAGASPVTAAGADSTTTASKSDDATAGKSTKQSSRHSKRDENRKSDKAASKSSDTRKAPDGDAAGGTPSAISPSVANANAQLTSD